MAAGCNSGRARIRSISARSCRGQRAVGPGDLNGGHDVEERHRCGVEAELHESRDDRLIVDAERRRKLSPAFRGRFLLAGALEQFLVSTPKIVGLQGTAPLA